VKTMRARGPGVIATTVWLLLTGPASAVVLEMPQPPYWQRIPEYAQRMPPESPASAAFRAGVQALLGNDLKLAETEFQRAAQLDARIPEPLLGLADVALRQGRAPDALRLLKQAESLAPKDPAVYLGLGRYYRSQGDRSNAEQSLLRGLQTGASAAPVHLELGDLYLEGGRPSDAVDQFELARKANPGSAQAAYGLGVALAGTGRATEAAAALEAASDLAPNDPAPRQGLARLYAEQKQYDAALKSIDAAVALAPKSSQLHLDRGDILAMKGDLRGAEQAYRSAIERDASNAAALNNVAWLLAARKADLDEALSFARRAVELQPKNAGFADTLGAVYLARGQGTDAARVLTGAIALAPNLPDPHYHLALAQMDAGDVAEARASFQKALQLGLAEPQARAVAVRPLTDLRPRAARVMCVPLVPGCLAARYALRLATGAGHVGATDRHRRGCTHRAIRPARHEAGAAQPARRMGLGRRGHGAGRFRLRLAASGHALPADHRPAGAPADRRRSRVAVWLAARPLPQPSPPGMNARERP
jgi:Flp pilus assembly protein TadD